MLIARQLLFVLLTLTLPGHAQQIVAHRGASHDAPENTLAAFRLAFEQGADAAEGDFYLSSDGEVVCIHDGSTKRTAGVDKVVAKTTLAELRRLDVGAWKSPRFAGERIPTLSEVLAIVPPGKSFLIEVKCGPEIVPALARIVKSSGLETEQVRVIAFDAKVIAAAKRAMPKIEAYWLTSHRQDKRTKLWSNPIADVIPTLRRIGADGLDTSVPPQVVDASFVRSLREAGMQFHAWTVDDAATAARLYWLGVDSITTNKPAYLRSVLPERNLQSHVLLHLPLDGDLRNAGPENGMAKLLPARTGQTEPRWVPGVYGRALDLGDSARAVRIDRSLPERGALAMWYRPRGWYDYQTIVDSPANGNAWEMWIYRNAELRCRAHPKGNSVRHAFHQSGDADEWHHIAISWDRKNSGPDALQLFVNGHLAASCAWSQRGWFDPGKCFFLGGGNTSNTRARGTFDEVVLFDIPLDLDLVRFVKSAALGGS